MTKKCLKCLEIKSIEEFSFKNKIHGKRHCYCKDCFVILRKNSYQKNKQRYIDKSKQRKNDIAKWFLSIKKELKCENCGFSHQAALDFHHPDGDKEYNVATLVGNGNRIKILNEIKKCSVLCSNCHRILHYNERNIGR